jgi:hypothetical protein
MHNKGKNMSQINLSLTETELEIVYDALEELRLTGGWTNDDAEQIANDVQDKILEIFRKKFKTGAV